jgi:ABC-2 type transport system permease protein
MRTRIKALMRKEFIHILRDPRSLAVIFLMPVMMVVIYGYAINFDIHDIKIGLLDESRSTESRQLIERLTSSHYFIITSSLNSRDEIEDAFLKRRFLAALIIPTRFADDLRTLPSADVQVVVDGSNANSATVAVNYLRSALLQYSLDLNTPGFQPPIQIEPRVWYNPDLKSTHFIVPGLIAVLMMMVCAMLTSVTIVRERETGTMEQIFVSPIHPIEIVIGKIAPYVLLALLDGLGILLFSRLIFSVPFRGNGLLLLMLSAVFVYASLSIGLLISTRVKTQQAAMMFSMLITILPSILLSGFIYPIASLPIVLRAISYIIPAKYFLIIDRGIILKGMGFSHLYEQTLFLFIFGTLLLSVSIKNFKTHLEG